MLKRGAPIGPNEVKVGVPLPWFSEGTQERIRATVAALQAKG